MGRLTRIVSHGEIAIQCQRIALKRILLLLIAIGSVGRTSANPSAPAIDSPPAKNWVSHLDIQQNAGGVWTARFDYAYSGDPRFGTLHIRLVSPGASSDPVEIEKLDMMMASPQVGVHHVSTEIKYPGERRTIAVEANLQDPFPSENVIAGQRIDKVIDWPNFQTWMTSRQQALHTPEQNLTRAVALIDTEDQSHLAEAKRLLERLLADNPRFDAAYVELARVAMKTNGGEESLHQADNLLASALEINPSSVNAKVLLGYVYTQQKRFPQAEALFSDAAKSKTSNLWLWTNWGDLLSMEGKDDQAIKKYREAIGRPMTHDTYDRARINAYHQLLELLEARKDFDGMEALFKQRRSEFGPGSCYSADYARFELQERGNTQQAIDLARGALDQDCEDSEARQVLGMAKYAQWAGEPQGTKRAESLNQARIFLPAGPMALYLLASSDWTVGAAKQLLASGESIDQKDNEKLTALAHALGEQNLGAARRLLVLGARPDATVGYGEVPVALIPVLAGNIDAIRLFKEFKVNYSTVRYHGATAIDIAKQTGNSAMVEALGEKQTNL